MGDRKLLNSGGATAAVNLRIWLGQLSGGKVNLPQEIRSNQKGARLVPENRTPSGFGAAVISTCESGYPVGILEIYSSNIPAGQLHEFCRSGLRQLDEVAKVGTRLAFKNETLEPATTDLKKNVQAPTYVWFSFVRESGGTGGLSFIVMQGPTKIMAAHDKVSRTENQRPLLGKGSGKDLAGVVGTK